MKPFTSMTSVIAPFDRSNVDTDMIIPKQFLKSTQKQGFGKHLFDSLRYEPVTNENGDRVENPLFVLNNPLYRKANILLARDNFGCGSSREHAPWALLDFGFRCIIAPSFADIFFNNCFKNGILPITLTHDQVDNLFTQCEQSPGLQATVDLDEQTITVSHGESFSFVIDAFKKHCLQHGLDDIGLTLTHADEIKAFEQMYYARFPWLNNA